MSIEIRQGDRQSTEHPLLPITLVLDRLRSAHNVGNIFRLADAVNAEEILTCGYTATPPHPKLLKTAMGTDEMVKCRHFDTSLEALTELKNNGYQIIGVETAENAISFNDATINPKTAFVFGNEALGISEEALALCDQFVCLPALGRKNSINVSNCAAVILFDAAHKLINKE